MIGSRMDGLIPFLEKLPRGALLVETGRARGDSAGHRTGDGWSTLLLARHAQRLDGLLVSIDLDASTEPLCRRLLGTELASHVRFINGPSDKVFGGSDFTNVTQGRKARFVLLDSSRDPNVCVAEYAALKDKLTGHAYLAIDDSEVKGKILVPQLQAAEEWVQQRLDDPVVFQWRQAR